MTKGYIFDYGGTLDTGGCHWGRLIWKAYRRQDVPVTEERFREAYVFAERQLGRNPIVKPHFTFRQTLAEKLHIEMEYIDALQPQQPVSGWFEQVHNVLYENTVAETSKSVEALRRLKARGVPMVLVSNFYGNINTVLEEFGFQGLFDSIVESAVVGVRKPDPRIFSFGVEALGLDAPDVTVVGDSYDKDIVPAKRIGCQTVWIKGEQWNREDDHVNREFPEADRIVTGLYEALFPDAESSSR